MESSKIIQINQLVKSFPMGKGEFVALKGIDLQIGTGEFCGLIGPSGSGKTTLLNIIGSLDVPTHGEAVVLGQPISKLSARGAAALRKQKLGFIFQSYNLLAVHTVFENVEFPLLLLDFTASERRKMVMDALEWVGLTDKTHSKPPKLSGGECQRVAIARAMVKKPSLVLADEPTANLDADNSHHILKTMETLNKELKTTFLFATHDEKVIGYLRRKIFLKDGMIDKDVWVNDLIEAS
ncbi:MAG: ABC transporter ATP-binding protein [Bacteroidales bacterium]